MKLPALISFKIIKTMALKPFSSRSSVIVVITLLCFTQSTVAQSRRLNSDSRNSWEFGISGGVSQFQTTINPSSDAPFKKFNYWNVNFNPAVSLSVIKNISPKFSAEFEWMTTKLSGSWNPNNGYPVPPLATDQGLEYPEPFKTGINQFNLLFVANLNQLVVPNRTNDRWYLFVKAGGGAALLKGYNALYAYIKTANSFEYAIVYGGGISYQINEKVKLKLGLNWHRVESDRLDGVHTVLAGVTTLKPGANPPGVDPHYFNTKERYIYPYIGMTYGLGTVQSKAHFIRSQNSLFRWFKPAKRKYRR